MRLRPLVLASLILLPSATGLSRGGETGTLDVAEPIFYSTDPFPGYHSDGHWPRFFLERDHYRRLRARLAVEPSAPIPGWPGRTAIRWKDFFVTQDGQYEVLPID